MAFLKDWWYLFELSLWLAVWASSNKNLQLCLNPVGKGKKFSGRETIGLKAILLLLQQNIILSNDNMSYTLKFSLFFKYMWRRIIFFISCRTGFKDSLSSSWQGDNGIIQTLETTLVLKFSNRNTSLSTSLWKKYSTYLWLILLPLMSLKHPLNERELKLWVRSKVDIYSHELNKRSYRNES